MEEVVKLPEGWSVTYDSCVGYTMHDETGMLLSQYPVDSPAWRRASVVQEGKKRYAERASELRKTCQTCHFWRKKTWHEKREEWRREKVGLNWKAKLLFWLKDSGVCYIIPASWSEWIDWAFLMYSGDGCNKWEVRSG